MVGDILQPTHLIFVLVIALLVLGPKRLPEVGRSLGKGLRDFRMAMSGEESGGHEEIVQPVAGAAVAETQPVANAPVAETQPVASAPVVATQPEPSAETAPVPQWGAVHQPTPVAVAEPETASEHEPVEHTS